MACLSLLRQPWTQVRVVPISAASIYPGMGNPLDFNLDPQFYPARLVRDESVPPESLPQDLRPTDDPRLDRVFESRLQEFSLPYWDIVYQTGLGLGSLTIAGQRPSVLTHSQAKPFRRRLWFFRITLALLSLLALGVSFLYSVRHLWFLLYGHPGKVLLAGLLLAVLGAYTVRNACLRRSPKTLLRAGLSALGTALAAASLLYWGIIKGPSASHAQSVWAASDERQALVEAEVLIDLNVDCSGGETVLDQIHLQKVQRAKDVKEMEALVSQPWKKPEFQTQAYALYTSAALKEAKALYVRRDELGLRGLIDNAFEQPEILNWGKGYLSLIEAEKCAKKNDFGCALAYWKATDGYPDPDELRAAVQTGIGKEMNRRIGELKSAEREAKRASDKLAALRETRLIYTQGQSFFKELSSGELEDLDRRIAAAESAEKIERSRCARSGR